MLILLGIPASPGLAAGKAFIYTDSAPMVPRYEVEDTELDSERRRLREALSLAEQEVRELRDRAADEMGLDHAKIFEAHLLMLSDAELLEEIDGRLVSEKLNIEWIIWDTTQELVQRLSQAADPNLRERSIDIHDVSRRLLSHLLRVNHMSLSSLDEDVVLVAHNLLPSDVLMMDRKRVKALVLDVGGRTSHTAILARAFEIPAVLGLSDATKTIKPGSPLIVDGGTGKVALDPDQALIKRYRCLAARLRSNQSAQLAERDLPAETTDGRRVALKANIEIPDEAAHALEFGAEGIGLYRSEFLFLTPGRIAGEEEQYKAYRGVLEAMADRPVTIRTLDLGGDKLIPELQNDRENNPLLGWRAIRFCLSNRELFKTQLRALLRAGTVGDLRVMFPMISGVEELEDVFALWEEAKAECAARACQYKAELPLGIMIEVPSAAMTADILAKHAAFFSIGTNDLVQYSVAADRGNERVAYLARPFHPAVLRFIKRIIDAAREKGISSAMCGEMAGDPYAAPLLLGLGLDEFSMTAFALPIIRRIIRGVSYEECRSLAEEAFRLESYRDINTLVHGWVDSRFPGLETGL